ncbi:Hypothetical protein PORT_23 [Enterococcus phage Porthos]|uniref:Uncharacterized protein n=2 Tax=Enterococcus phage Porthos TaxID=2795670 RepID=A0ACB0DNQ2_9CAUD|nr:Hypothetical protein PORT_23 [Enterococcus phage Porthos]
MSAEGARNAVAKKEQEIKEKIARKLGKPSLKTKVFNL